MSKIEAIVCPDCGEARKKAEPIKIDGHAMETIKMNQDSLDVTKKPCQKCSNPNTRS